ncbi:MAG TPA: terminase gpA endonuclease subunit [Anaerolineales bacterium]|nr:terminase gpA endonuclease subunit [Anaerolineales bacterium]
MSASPTITTISDQPVINPERPVVLFSLGERRVFSRRERISTAAWAEKYRVVVGPPMPGRWRNDATPCAVGVMDALDDPSIREIYVQAAPQTIKTQSIINYLLRRIDQQPTSIAYVMPDEKKTKRIMKRRLLPTIKETPKTAELMSNRADDTTTLDVQFQNGANLFVAWASSPSALSSDAVEIMILDEMNKFPPPQGAEPDACSLADQRTNSYSSTYKIYGCSSPTDEVGLVTKAIKERADEIRYYEAKCPICGEYQRMLWENISWGNTRDPREVLRKNQVRYHCSSCGMAWDDAMRDRAVRAGRWMAYKEVEPGQWEPFHGVERPTVVAFMLPSWYVIPLARPVAAFLRGLDDREAMRTWVTQHCAEPFLETVIKKTDTVVLSRKTDYPPLIVPPEAVALTAGIDMQKSGFWFVVRAWAEDLTSWLIQYGQLLSFHDIEDLLYRTAYQVHDSNKTMGIRRAALDTGGGQSPDGDWSRTEEAYEWLRNQPPGRIYGTKGSSHRFSMQGKHIQVKRIDTLPSSGKLIRGGLELRIINTDAYKKTIFWRLGRKESEDGKLPESQRFYVHSETGMDYVRQLLSEEQRKDRRGVVSWKKTFHANHLLDCEILAAVCADSEWIPSIKMLAVFLKNKTHPNNDHRPANRQDSKQKEKRRLW